MHAQQVVLVRQTWERVKPHADAVADIFYARLFELDPTLRLFFKADMRAQGRKLTSTIGLAVASLDRLEEVLPAVRQLGRRHACFGVRDEHYATVGAALLDTLDAGLKDAFTPEVKAAWSALYSGVATEMKRGAGDPRPLEPSVMMKQHETGSPGTASRRLVGRVVEIDRHRERAHRMRARYLNRIARRSLRAILRWSRQRVIGMQARRESTVLRPFEVTTHD